jgi:YjbE family integral membrane protein
MKPETMFDFVQIIFADIVLSGDNALIIGMAAAGLSPEFRKKAIMLGLALAAGLRIVFAVLASAMMAIPGILFLGGLLLSWVCWRFFRELRQDVPDAASHTLEAAGYQGPPRRQLMSALVTITVADVSMSIDNVVAVAAIARENTALLVFGLGLSIGLMAFCATMVMRMLTRYPWISYLGLAFLVYLAADMLIAGWPDLARYAGLSGPVT